jgi:calcium-dependent protein kinase
MPRIDAWDVVSYDALQSVDCGFQRGITDKYDVAGGARLGEGGFGSVRIITRRSDGAQLACKSIAKRLDVPNLAATKQQQHLDNIKREVAVLRKLRGTLNVVSLEDVYEDDQAVHIVSPMAAAGSG